MSLDSSLEWIQRNRQRRTRTVSVSEPIGRLVERTGNPSGEDAAMVVGLLQSCVDGAFRRSCRVFVRVDGAISIQVQRAGEVYVMRQRWLATVTKQIAAVAPRLAGRRVLFEQGIVGAGFDG